MIVGALVLPLITFGHDARICDTQVQYSHDPEPWIDHVADPAKEDRIWPR